MPSARRARLGLAFTTALWINTGFWLVQVCLASTTSSELGLLTVSAAVALAATAIHANGRRIARLEQTCCSLTRLILQSEILEEDQRRHLTAVR